MCGPAHPLRGLTWLGLEGDGLDRDGDAVSQFEQRDRHAEVAHEMMARDCAYRLDHHARGRRAPPSLPPPDNGPATTTRVGGGCRNENVSLAGGATTTRVGGETSRPGQSCAPTLTATRAEEDSMTASSTELVSACPPHARAEEDRGIQYPDRRCSDRHARVMRRINLFRFGSPDCHARKEEVRIAPRTKVAPHTDMRAGGGT